MGEPMTNPAIEAIRGFHDELTAIRRDLHANPELGLEEHRTAEIVATKLAEWGIEVHRGIGKTGVVGVLRRGSAASRSACAPTWTACRWTSRPTCPIAAAAPGGCMPAATTATPPCCWARRSYLAASPAFQGTVHFIFQPGEEGVGGALAMLRGRAVREISLRCDLRPAQPAGHAGRDSSRSARGRRRRAARSSISPSPGTARTAPGPRRASIRCWWRRTSSRRCSRSWRATCRRRTRPC